MSINVLMMALLLTIAAPMLARGQSASDIKVLNGQVAQLYGQGKYLEAIAVARQSLTLAEQALGKEHPDTLTSVNNLGRLYVNQKRYDEAEPLLKRALEARERVLGKEHPDTIESWSNLAWLYLNQERYDEVESLLKRAR